MTRIAYLYPMKHLWLTAIGFVSLTVSAQSYTSYRTGNSTSITTTPSGGVCLMGGASEDDEGMRWFLQRANGGDVLVLRATGSDGYNNYMYAQLGVTLNSVETIVCHNASCANEAYIQQRIQEAEAIWFAGGDQYTYISYWRNTAIDNLINDAIANRNLIIGGTSAGMAILGQYYFSAQNGTITSVQALNNPYHVNCTPDITPFIQHPLMAGIITDTHFDNPDRTGRLATFMARLKKDYNINSKAIACDEYTAVCIDPNGMAVVYGGHPTYDDNAYFVSVNCELSATTPEACTNGIPLTWNLSGNALAVYKTKGTATASQNLNLSNWQIGNGGTWDRWSVQNGVLTETSSSVVNCVSTQVSFTEIQTISTFPNPTFNENFVINHGVSNVRHVQLYDCAGKEISANFQYNPEAILVTLEQPFSGILIGVIHSSNAVHTVKVVIE